MKKVNYKNFVPIKLDLQTRLSNDFDTIAMTIEEIKMYFPSFYDDRLFVITDTSSNKSYIVFPIIQVWGEDFSLRCIAKELWHALDDVLYAKQPYKGRMMNVKDAVRALYIHNVILGFGEDENYQDILDVLGTAFPKLDSVEAVKKVLEKSRRDDTSRTNTVEIYGERISANLLSNLFVCGGKCNGIGEYLHHRIHRHTTTPLETAKEIWPENPEQFLEVVKFHLSH